MGAFPLQALVRAANQVKTVGAAQAAASAALAAAVKGRIVADHELPSGLSGVFAGSGSAAVAVRDIDNASLRVQAAARANVGGSRRQGISSAYTAPGGLRDQLTGLYGILFDVYDRAGRPGDFLSGLVADLGREIEKFNDTQLAGKGLLERAGTIIGAGAKEAGAGVGAAGKGVADAAKLAVKPILGSLALPLAIGAGVIVVVGLVYVFTLSKVRP